MARNFAGADFITTGIGGLVGIGSSGHTLFAICRRAANGAWHTPISIETSANSSKLAMQFSDTNRIQLIIGSSNKDTTVAISSADNWVLAAVTRASGSSVPRGHKYVYDTNTWTHTDAGAASGGDSTDLTGGRAQLGRWQTTDFFNGDIALGGALKRALTDGELENLPLTLQAAAFAAPDGLWLLDQHATTQTVIDLTGNGANQTGVTNTSIASTSTPLWSYGAGASMAVGRSGGGTTHSADAASTVTAARTAAAAVDRPVSAAVTVTATRTAAVSADRPAAAAASTTATITAAASNTAAATAAATTTATLAVAATVDRSADAAVSASANLAAAAAADRPAAAAVTATATITAAADISGRVDADAALTVTAATTAAAAVTTAGSADLTTVAALSASVSVTRNVTAAFTATATITVASDAAAARATSTAVVAAGRTSVSTVTGEDATSVVTARATSSGGVT